MEHILGTVFRIGISGHRDLASSQKQRNIRLLKSYLLELGWAYPDVELRVVTALADGADRLIVKAARELGIGFEVVLPMPKDLYAVDFDAASLAEFDMLLHEAVAFRSVGLCPGNTLESIAVYSPQRDRQYRQVGMEICDLADVMVFMSNGVKNGKVGGTEDIKVYALERNKAMHVIPCEREVNSR